MSALPIAGCDTCDRCLSGEPGLCRAGADLFGVSGRHGAYAEYACVDARESFAVGDAMTDSAAALVEPVAVGLHALAAAQLAPGERVLVIGGGPVGLTCAVAARALGAGEVVVSEPVAGRRSVVERSASVATIDPTGHDVGEEFARLAGGPPDVIVEAVGAVGMLQHAVDISALHGRIVVAGVCTKPDPVVPIAALMKELTLRFAIYYRRREFAAALDLVDRQAASLGEMVTATVGLDGLPAAFSDLRSPEKAGGACKVLVQPGRQSES